MKRFLLLWISFIVFLTAPLLHAAKAKELSDHGTILQEILILNSYHPGFAWSDDEQAGIIDVFRGKDKNRLPVIEYLDLKRLPDGRHLAELEKLFRRKYQNQKFSAVIAMDDPALEFAIDNQAELFRNASIVFCGINNYKPSLLKGHPDVTGIAESIDIAETIEVMLRLHPATREIFIPHDYTVSVLAVRKEIEALVPRFGAKVRFRFSDPLTMEELLKELERLPKDSLVLEIGFITDKSGRTFGMTEAVMLFFEHSPVPVYSPYEQRLGFGIVGGKLLSARIHGANAARIALQVLAGEKASAIPVVLESDSQFMFDYKVMSRFGIPLSALPEGSTVINKPVSFYAAHRVVIQTALGVIGFMAVVISLLTINIIQRRRSAIALRRSEENFRHSFDDSPMGVRIVTIEGETIYANRAILDIYGYDSVEELRTTPIKKRYTPESQADFLIRREKRQQGVDVPSEYTINIIRKDGEVRHLQVFRKEILWDGERQFQVLYNDVTERKRMEEELRESEEKYRNLVENAGEAIFVAQDGKLVFINPMTAIIIGYSAEELTEKTFMEFIHPDDRDMVIDRHFKRIEGEELPHIYPFRIIHRDGSIRWVELNAVLIHWKGKAATLNFLSNITDRKRAEEELRASEQKLRAFAGRLQKIREEERGMIAREIHDEMGGGLTGLKMDLSWLLRKMSDADPGEARVALMDKIHTSNELIDHMIHEVRRISTDLRPSVLDDLGLIAALEWQLSEFTSRTEIPHEFATTIKYVNMEEDTAIAVFRIFQEALTNVARHSRATKVAVVLREGERSLFGDESLVLEVRDNGRGITEEEILNPESLGLLGMKERVLAFGGELSIRGEPGGGTVLVLKIPRKQGEAS